MKPGEVDSTANHPHTGNWLFKYASDKYSQAGEDGMIGKIFSILPGISKWCVEFGAWDGKHFSNTHLLLSQKGWSGVLIEADPNKFKELCQTYAKNDRITCLNKLVSFDGEDRLDHLLAQTPVIEEFDLLSIDVDGNDFHIWKSLQVYRPKVVVIEFNPTIPNDISFVQEADLKVNQGSSLLSLCELSKSKDYELVGVTDLNAFFVDAKYFPLFQMENNSPSELNTNQKHTTQVFQLYDGTLVWTGNLKLLWHDMDMIPEKLQVLPKRFRLFPEIRMPWFRRLLFSCWKRLNLR